MNDTFAMRFTLIKPMNVFLRLPRGRDHEGGDMRSFNVFLGDDGDYKAVKQGWCWPAFFFGSIWALFSGLWLTTFLVFPIDFVFGIADNRMGDPEYDGSRQIGLLILSSIPLVVRLTLGFFGNTWRARKLRRLGFSHLRCVKADGKEHAISLCKAAPNADAPSVDNDRNPEPVDRPRPAPKKEARPVSEDAVDSVVTAEITPYASDSLRLILATLIGIAWCVSVVGLLPASILLFGLVASLKNGDQKYLKIATKFVSGFGYVVATVSAGGGVVLVFINFQNALAAFGMAGLSFAMIFALRYLWLNPLLRQFDSIRSFVLGIQIPDVPKRPTTQKIVTRSGLQTYSVADEIAKWKALHDQGVINDDEYQQVRSLLLNPT